MVTKRTKSDTGKDLIVDITDDEIRAYAVDKPILKVYGKKKGLSEKMLEEKLYKRPVMSIKKMGENNFHVDFSAGLQRAWITGQTKKDLTEEVHVDMYHGEDIDSDKGWLEWIGLDPKDKDLDAFLGRKKRKLKDVI